MIQILIVEDEYWIRKGIIRAIQWDRLSMELAGEAQNGAEAVKLLDRQPVDIIVMDMRMPIMNGEELLKHLRGTGYRGGLIVLSEHSDYGFMHQAILSQADEYMLKPLDEKELNDALMRIRDRLLIQSSSGEPVSRILDALISNAPMPKPPPSPFHCVIAALWAGNLQDVPFRQNDVLNANYYWRKLDRHTGILICFDFADAHSLRKNLETAVQNWEDASKAPVLLGLSQAYAKMPPQDAYAKAQQALQYLHAASPVVSYDETAALSLPPPMTLIQAPLLEKLLASAEFGQTEAIARQLLSPLHASRWNSVASVQSAILEFYAILKRICAAAGANTQTLTEYLPQVQALHTLADAQSCVASLLSAALSAMFPFRSAQGTDIVERITAYVETNYADEINLLSLSKQYHINYIYLSRLFKKQTGKNFTDYLLEIRMTHAKRLLHQADLPVRNIAAMVGYANPYYFSTCYQRYHGCAPRDDRE